MKKVIIIVLLLSAIAYISYLINSYFENLTVPFPHGIDIKGNG